MSMQTIIPNKGLDFLDLYSSLSETKEALEKREIEYSEEVWDNSDCDVKFNWHVISIDNAISLFFSEGNNKMFKICANNRSGASLPNGIGFNTLISDAQRIDPSITYNDWEEIYLSDNGYWLEEDPETGKVFSITIYAKELNDSDFDLCQW